MLWCEKRGNNGVFYVLVDLKVKSEESIVFENLSEEENVA
jgi:hypothetical protein